MCNEHICPENTTKITLLTESGYETIRRNYPGVPDLAIEVVSSENKPDALILQARRYLERGTEEVWVIYPEAEEIHPYHKHQVDMVRVYRGSEKLDASAFFPGVTRAMAELVSLPDPD